MTEKLMIGIYLIMSTAIFGFLFAVWTRQTRANYAIKVVFFLMFLFGIWSMILLGDVIEILQAKGLI